MYLSQSKQSIQQNFDGGGDGENYNRKMTSNV